MTSLSIVITTCLLYAHMVTCLYCVKHTSRQHGGYSALDTCKINKNRPIAAAAALSNKIETSTQQNNLTFDLTCKASVSECQGVSATLLKATDIISDIFLFETPLVINASYVSFCQEYQDCHHDAKYASIGQAYPSISYVMMDNTDKMTRLYPQPLLKQYTNISVKPSWTPYDIEAQFNNEINWYFVNNDDPIQSSQTDFLRNVVHELIHGLGFMTSWSDDFYQAMSLLFDSGKLEPFITPTLLAQTSNHQLMSDYSSHQPFWGFAEFPFDKYIHYKTNSNSYTSFTSTTQQLNHFSGSNATFRNMVDLANAWYASDEYTSSKRLYTKAVTFLDVLAVIDNEPLLFLETSVNPFSSGSSLCHVDQSQYLNTTEYLMVYLANAGIDIYQLDQMFPQGPLGPKLLKVMATLGYRVKVSNISTDRPSLSYWTPPQGLVGTDSNPTPSLSIVTAGPARMPTSSTTPTAGSTSTHPSTTSSAAASLLLPQYWHPLLLCIITFMCI